MGDGSVRLVLLAAGIALAASPALSQGAMTPGGGAMAPQPRVAPAPQAPVVAPIAAPQVPLVAPALSGDRVIQTTNSLRTTGTPTGPANPVANNSNQPIPSVNVMVRKQPGGGAISTAKTDGNGQTTFRQLEPGTYDVALPSVPGGTVSMTTFVNGTLASRTDFPVGSSVGTFTVGSARDTVILKFQTNLGTTPVNGIGGTGGGRFQTNQGSTPTNGIGGMGGGRLTTGEGSTPTNAIGGQGGGRYTFKPGQQ